jgi:hypothetical protein
MLSKVLRHDAWYLKRYEHATERHMCTGPRTVYLINGPLA